MGRASVFAAEPRRQASRAESRGVVTFNDKQRGPVKCRRDLRPPIDVPERRPPAVEEIRIEGHRVPGVVCQPFDRFDGWQQRVGTPTCQLANLPFEWRQT